MQSFNDGRRYALTKRQQQAFLCIQAYIKEHGQSPNYRELMDAMNIKSLGHMAEIVKGLKDRGWIDYLPNKARSIIILGKGK